MRVFKFFEISAALAVLAASLCTNVVWAQDQIAIYRVLPVQVTRDSVLKLAREAFSMASPQVSEDDIAFMLAQEQKRLTVWKASGAMLFADDSKLWNPDYQITSPTDPESAAQLAVQFLKTYNLLPPQAVLEGIFAPFAQVHYVKGADGQEVPNHWSVRFTLLVDSGTPLGLVSIDKAQLLLQLGQNGEVIGLDFHWRNLGERQLVPRVTAAQARELLAWKNKLPLSQVPPINNPLHPQYTLHYPEVPQAWLYPLYHLLLIDPERGQMVGGIVPASRFSVLARIASPQPDQSFPPDTPVELRAEVREGFGSPPYRYAWYSVRDGLISQAAVARVRLSPGVHQLWLYVTDRNGTQDSQTLYINVEGESSATSGTSLWQLPLIASGAGLGMIGVLGFKRRSRRLGIVALLLLSLA